MRTALKVGDKVRTSCDTRTVFGTSHPRHSVVDVVVAYLNEKHEDVYGTRFQTTGLVQWFRGNDLEALEG